jgi:hypothetical protein
MVSHPVTMMAHILTTNQQTAFSAASGLQSAKCGEQGKGGGDVGSR